MMTTLSIKSLVNHTTCWLVWLSDKKHWQLILLEITAVHFLTAPTQCSVTIHCKHRPTTLPFTANLFYNLCYPLNANMPWTHRCWIRFDTVAKQIVKSSNHPLVSHLVVSGSVVRCTSTSVPLSVSASCLPSRSRLWCIWEIFHAVVVAYKESKYISCQQRHCKLKNPPE